MEHTSCAGEGLTDAIRNNQEGGTFQVTMQFQDKKARPIGLDTELVQRVYDQFGITESRLADGDASVSKGLELASKVYHDVPKIQSELEVVKGFRGQDGPRDGSMGDVAAKPSTSPTAAAAGAASQTGLKHFTVRLCEIIETRRCVTYNEIADALVEELQQEYQAGVLDVPPEEKNVRRRVYDALNVLDAIGVVHKESSKSIRWVGWPTERNDKRIAARSNLERLRLKRDELVEQVQGQLTSNAESATKLFCLSNLILRNQDAPLPLLLVAQEKGIQTPNPFTVPFMMIKAPSHAKTDVHLSEDCHRASLDFHDAFFQIFDDMGVMRMMGLDKPCPNLFSSPL